MWSNGQMDRGYFETCDRILKKCDDDYGKFQAKDCNYSSLPFKFPNALLVSTFFGRKWKLKGQTTLFEFPKESS